jgi:Xaa-Pro aminopeptidase
MDFFGHRRQALAKALKPDGLDALLVTTPANVRYLTGFTGDSSYLVLTARHLILVSDDRFADQIAEECPGVEMHIRPHHRSTPEAAGEVLTKAGAKAVGVEADHVTLGLLEDLRAAAPKATFVPVRGRVEALRACKDASEVERIRAAIGVAERAFGMFKALVRETDTEKDLADALDGFIRRAGGCGSSFPPIVAVGDRGALPHAPPTARPLTDGSKLLIDWGADRDGYKSDLTRTVRSPFAVAPNRRNKKERVGLHFEEIHEWVRKAQDAALAAVRDGVPARDVDAAARKVLATARVKGHPELNLADHFTHGLGHGLGLDVHEAPRVRQNSTDVLQTGMVITLEPGVYIPGWGGVRIEDDVLVRRDGGVRLTTLPHDPHLLG